MPRPGPRRPLVALRLSEQGIERIDQRAKAAGVSRSEMMRALMAYADRKLPADWKPRP